MTGKKLKRTTYVGSLDKIGEATLLEKLAGGLTMASLARELGISNMTLYNWVAMNEERKQRFYDARIMAADQWADECLTIADGADKLTANEDRLRIDTRKWMAGYTNPDKYRAAPIVQAAVQVNVNQLHLDALRQLNLAPPVEVELKKVGTYNLDADDLPDPD